MTLTPRWQRIAGESARTQAIRNLANAVAGRPLRPTTSAAGVQTRTPKQLLGTATGAPTGGAVNVTYRNSTVPATVIGEGLTIAENTRVVMLWAGTQVFVIGVA
jgi:hypothetical protein